MKTASSPGQLREDILVAIAAGADGSYPLDPIRLMKACFLVSQRGRPRWREAFEFEPYDYGPFDRSVYRARDALLARGLLAADTESRYPTYRLTEDGRERLKGITEGPEDVEIMWLGRVGKYVTAKSFSSLLDEVYGAFPEYAVRSVAW